MFDLSNRVAVVTGAGQGIGAAIAETLARQKASVAVNDVDRSRARSTVDRIVASGGRAHAAVADVTDYRAVAGMMADVEASLGPVDVLVNNAGIPVTGITLVPFVETVPLDWEPFVSLNLYGVLNCVHLVLAGMIGRGWGRVVTIISDAGRIGEPRQAVYAASKAAAAGFSRSIAKEVGPHGVTSNCVALGSIERPDGEGRSDPDRLAKQLRLYQVKRLGTPGDVAAAVAWLVSEEAGWVTGQTIPVNGGYSTS
jgi:3-oxoacyl-[acyl-carrier protein] reductase